MFGFAGLGFALGVWGLGFRVRLQKPLLRELRDPGFEARNAWPGSSNLPMRRLSARQSLEHGGANKARMPSSTLIPFLGGLGSLINPFKQKRAPFLSLGYWAA